MRPFLWTPLASFLLAACGGDGVGNDGGGGVTYASLRAEYDRIEGEAFPGSKTLPSNFPPRGAIYEGAAALAYYEDGTTFSEVAAARVELTADFLSGNIGGSLTDFQLQSGTPVSGTIAVTTVSFVGADFDTTVDGTLDIGGSSTAFTGTLDGALRTASGSSTEAEFAYGNTSFDGGTGQPRFGGTFAAQR